MMTSLESAASSTGAGKYPRLYKWAGYFTTACFILIGCVKAIGFFTLPSCDSSGIQDTVRSIYKGQGVELDQITNVKQVSDDKGQYGCAARIQGAGETADITYRVFWDGWSKKVQIGNVTQVNTAPAK